VGVLLISCRTTQTRILEEKSFHRRQELTTFVVFCGLAACGAGVPRRAGPLIPTPERVSTVYRTGRMEPRAPKRLAGWLSVPYRGELRRVQSHCKTAWRKAAKSQPSEAEWPSEFQCSARAQRERARIRERWKLTIRDLWAMTTP